MPYHAPVADLLAAMRAAGGFAPRRPGEEPALTPADAESVLTEAAAIAEDLLLPLDRVGDRHGATLQDGRVTTAPGWAEAYRAWSAGGWLGVAAPVEAGGMGLPLLLHTAVMEIWSAANAAFAIGPVLTAGAIEALRHHGTPAQQALYLPKLIAGTWAGTMNLTEPQAGSDVGALRTRAEPQADGSYRISGAKIYITYGEHDLTENIVHLVLARLPDAPPGSRGISLFLVPKVLPDAEGRPGRRNDLVCTGLEHKLGLHGSPTCSMSYGDQGGATGWLVGEPNRGLACMFTMMNNARLAVGVQGVAAAERATQTAVAFAKARRQGRSRAGQDAAAPIIEHPDVARMLMSMQAETMAARAICHLTAAAIDRGDHDRAGLLTPLAKAYSTDVGIAVASLGVQVHGGMGYIEEAGAAQIYRDARIAAIYEGTNGIQAIDLVTRKLPLAQGRPVAEEIAAMWRIVDDVRAKGSPAYGAASGRLSEAIAAFETVVATLAAASPAAVLAGATATLRLFGLARGGTGLAAMALAEGTPRLIALTRFFAEQLCPEAAALVTVVTSGSGALEGAAAVFGDA